MPVWLQTILRYEPGISLGQWIYDRITNNWPSILALGWFFGMTVLGLITDWTRELGPAGIAGIAILTALAIWIGIALAQSLRAKARERNARSVALAKWQESTGDHVNPMLPEFHTKRIRLEDLMNPITRRIPKKRFIDCELVGPANITFFRADMADTNFINCDMVVVINEIPINNIMLFDDITAINSTFFGCTVFIPPSMVPKFAAMGANFLTLSGHPNIDREMIQRLAPTSESGATPGKAAPSGTRSP
jgi:hypothetical protein